MKKGGKIDTSRIEFGLEALKKELSKLNYQKRAKNTLNKSKNLKPRPHKVKKKLLPKKKALKHKTRKLIKKPLTIKEDNKKLSFFSKKPNIKLHFPRILPESQPIKEKETVKTPPEVFGKKKKIILSDEFKKLEGKFRYEFVFFFGLIIAFLGLFPESKINIFFIFGLSLMFIALFRYYLVKKKKNYPVIQKQTNLPIKKSLPKLIKSEKKTDGNKKTKLRKTNYTISIFIILIALIFALIKTDFKTLPPKVTIFMITLIGIVVILFFSVIILGRKRKYLSSEIDIKELRSTPIIIRKLNMPETYFDLLLEILNKRGLMTISEVARTFKITKQRAEEWANILSDHNLIILYYPPIGEPILKKITQKTEKEEEKRNAERSS